MPIKKLKDFLDSHKIKYTLISHSQSYTALEIASSAHIAGREMAKTVIIKIDGRLAMAVLPAAYKVDFELLQDALEAPSVELAGERDFEELFPDCDVGAMPPFGNLYGLEVYVDEKLAEDTEIAFNACSHTELMKLAYHDFAGLVKPRVMKFAT